MKLAGCVLALVVAVGLPLGLGCSKRYPGRVADVRDPPNTPCGQSQQCRRYGWCEEKEGECIATSDAHCENSELCRKGGLCSLEGRKCVARGGDCDASEWCTRFKLCSARDGVCK